MEGGGFMEKDAVLCLIWKMEIIFFVYCQRVNFIFAFSCPHLTNSTS